MEHFELAHSIVCKRSNIITRTCGFLTALCPGLIQADVWQPRAEVIQHWENEVRPGFNYHESRVPDYELPEILKTVDGRGIESKEEWLSNRPALLNLFREHVYGFRPDAPGTLEFSIEEQDPKAMEERATLKRIAITCMQDEDSFRFELILFIPNASDGPVPLFLLMNNRDAINTDPTREHQSDFWPAEAVVDRGYAIAAIQTNDLAPDSPGQFRAGVIRLFENIDEPRPPNAWGALSVWGWGASRAMDYFETDADIDTSRVALIGHSRGGKAALWAGAEDERFGLVISNESGSGGAALSRRRYGETVERVNRVFPHWFCANFHAYGGSNKSNLPIDQHQLIALTAPRGVYVGSADEDLWTDPRGEFMAVAHASAVYALWGSERIDPQTMPGISSPLTTRMQGYHIRSGNHNLTMLDWNRYMDFADGLFTRK